MSTADPPDVTNLPAFLAHLEERDIEASRFARLLLDEGWAVQVFWGPVQMDVWELTLMRGDWSVRFGIERGYSDGVLVAPAAVGTPRSGELRPVSLVIFSWAQTTDTTLGHELPDELNRYLNQHGRAALRWLADGNGQVVDAVYSEWRKYLLAEGRLRSRARGKPNPDTLRALRDRALTAMREAATTR